MTETALGAALKKAGVDSNEVWFLGALAKYLNNGGTIERAEALLAGAAKEMPGEGQPRSADQGQCSVAQARQPNGDAAGHSSSADQGHVPSARPSSTGSLPPRPAPREPSAADKSAAVKAAKGAAKAVTDKLGWLGNAHIPGGPKYVDLRVRDIEGMAERQLSEGATHARSAIALKMIEREIGKLGEVDSERKWVDVLPAKTVKQIAEATEAETLKPMAVGWLRGFNNQVQQTIAGGSNG